MGVLYSVLPLNDEIAAYLSARGSVVATHEGVTRNPTPTEIRHACESIPRLRARYNTHDGIWQADLEIETRWDEVSSTMINVLDFNGNENVPHQVYFEKGDPALILNVVRRLAIPCGPLVVVPDTGGEAPLTVTADDSIEDLLRTWEHSRSAAN